LSTRTRTATGSWKPK